MAHNKIHTLTAAVITALTLGLAACGNDQKPAAPAAPAASAAASAPASGQHRQPARPQRFATS